MIYIAFHKFKENLYPVLDFGGAVNEDKYPIKEFKTEAAALFYCRAENFHNYWIIPFNYSFDNNSISHL